jgi:hypothetical protein
MKMMTNSTASRAIASIAVWFVVCLVLYFGGFTFSPSEDWWRKIVGGVLIAIATIVSVLICTSRAGCGREGWKP